MFLRSFIKVRRWHARASDSIKSLSVHRNSEFSSEFDKNSKFSSKIDRNSEFLSKFDRNSEFSSEVDRNPECSSEADVRTEVATGSSCLHAVYIVTHEHYMTPPKHNCMMALHDSLPTKGGRTWPLSLLPPTPHTSFFKHRKKLEIHVANLWFTRKSRRYTYRRVLHFWSYGIVPSRFSKTAQFQLNPVILKLVINKYYSTVQSLYVAKITKIWTVYRASLSPRFSVMKSLYRELVLRQLDFFACSGLFRHGRFCRGPVIYWIHLRLNSKRIFTIVPGVMNISLLKRRRSRSSQPILTKYAPILTKSVSLLDSAYLSPRFYEKQTFSCGKWEISDTEILFTSILYW